MNHLKKFFTSLSLVFVPIVMISVTVYAAGSLTPTQPPTSTGHTLSDLYNKIAFDREASEGGGVFAPSAIPTRSLTEIYKTISEPKIRDLDLNTPRGRRSSQKDYVYDSVVGIVVDNSTGLMWKRCEEGKSGQNCSTGSTTTFRVAEAPDQCESQNFAGYSDWRLPTIEELLSIIDYSYRGYQTKVNQNAFPNVDTPLRPTLTSTENLSRSGEILGIYFYGGYIMSGSRGPIRCVRNHWEE